MNGLISDVKITDSKLAREAAELVRQHETEMFANDPTRLAYPRRICDRHRGLHDRRAASCHCARFERRAGRCWLSGDRVLACVCCWRSCHSCADRRA
jgi:hypothetical protein